MKSFVSGVSFLSSTVTVFSFSGVVGLFDLIFFGFDDTFNYFLSLNASGIDSRISLVCLN